MVLRVKPSMSRAVSYYPMIKFAIFLIAIALFCALIPEILRRTEGLRARLLRRRDGEKHVLKADPADAIWSRRAERRRKAAAKKVQKTES